MITHIDEYLKNDKPFYHIAHLRNKQRILDKGLRNGTNVQGICVVRSADERILKLIAVGQLNTIDDQGDVFCVFKIIPSKHKLTVSEIKPDITTEFTNPLHNYIRRKILLLDEDDIFIPEIHIPANAIGNFIELQSQLLQENLILELKYN